MKPKLMVISLDMVGRKTTAFDGLNRHMSPHFDFGPMEDVSNSQNNSKI